MLSGRIWQSVTGYVIIKIEGLSLERFLNIAASGGVHIWAVKRISYIELSARVSLSGYRKLKKLFKDSRYTITMDRLAGVPDKVGRANKRKFLFYGLGLLLVIAIVLSMFIWKIEINGENAARADVIQELGQQNIVPGTWKNGIDVRELENRLIMNHPELS